MQTNFSKIWDAIFANNFDIIKNLNAQEINFENEKGWTPLTGAIFNENLECVSLMLQNPDVQVNRPNQNGKNAFYYAFRTNDCENDKDRMDKIRMEFLAKEDTVFNFDSSFGKDVLKFAKEKNIEIPETKNAKTIEMDSKTFLFQDNGNLIVV